MINLRSPHDSSAEPEHPEEARFSVGQLVKHRRYKYRGVIVADDSVFSGSEQWYRKNQTQPPKNQPWYHVLVHDSGVVTYAAQSSLEDDDCGLAIDHPLLEMFFTSFEDGQYVRNDMPWNT